MPDIINIIAGNSYSTGRSYISVVDSTIDFPGLTVGNTIVPVLSALLEAGFELYDYDGTGNSTAYCLIRNGTNVYCNPMRVFEGRLNTSVTVTTAAGTVSGTLIVIGSNAIEILEITGDIVIIPISKIESVI